MVKGVGRIALLGLIALNGSALDLVSFQSIHDFKRSNADGEYLNDRVTEGTDGLLYGTALNGGGPDDGGLVFRMEKSGANYQILHVFGPSSATNGLSPWGGVIEGKDGKLYGATRHGGAEDVGIIYSIAKDGAAFTIVHTFTTNGASGTYPQNSVIQGSDGRLYGKTLSGGEGDAVTIFGLNTDGSDFRTLHSFTKKDIDHYTATSGVVEGSDGFLYGTSPVEGPTGWGSLFRIKKDGSGFETLHFFTSGTDGSVPEGSVTESSEGVLYGTTSAGGFDDFGVLYRINRDGTDYKILYEFTARNDQGYTPCSPPIEGPDGALYGTTYFGGPEDTGAIYRVNKDGSAMTFLYTFPGEHAPAFPYSALKLCSDRAFYGTTFNGTHENYGAVFRINPVMLQISGDAVGLNAMVGKTYALEFVNNFTESWTELGRFANTTGALRFQSQKASGTSSFGRESWSLKIIGIERRVASQPGPNGGRPTPSRRGLAGCDSNSLP